MNDIMASERKPKKDKEIVSELEYQLKDIRTQLNEQLKCLDVKLESHLAMLWELQDFYKRRSEVEMEYSKALDRLVKNIMLRHKAEKQRQELWPGYSTYTCWQTLLASTKRQSKDHSILSELYNNQMYSRFSELAEDIQRMYKKCREIGFDSHEELLKVLNELQSAMKTYHIYHGESKQAENKLRSVESQKQKVEQHASKGTLSRKFKSFEKQVEKATKSYEKQTEKRQAKYTENKMKALRARNDYLLSIDAANAAINKYYVEDLPDLVDCMDCGYHNTLARSMLMHISAEENVMRSRQACVDLMNKCVADLDQRQDKQRFLELNNQAFSLPKKFEFQAHKGDELCQISAQKPVQEELLERHINLAQRLKELKLENDEVWKTLETAESSLMNMINQKDYDISNLFMEEYRPPKSPIEHAKKRSDRMETEAFYIQKFREYMIGNNLIGRLHAKFSSIQKALGESNISTTTTGQRPPSLPPKPKKRRIGRAPLIGQPKLFGGSIEEYCEAANQEIPLIIRSCIKVINLYGKQHQGVFRVSGSQHEINEFKNAFERGDDPLMDMNDGKDINSVAGVLKLYFRELREPLFPTQLFDELISASKLPVKDYKRASTTSKDSDDSNKLETVPECISRVKELLRTLPRPIIVVMRYLFAFLNHLSEYSDENMMDPYNLAICYGPTLLPIPPDRDQVAFQGSVNELVKNIIVHQEEIFPNDGGMVYERCIVEDGEQEDTTDNMSEDGDTGDGASEEETEVMEASAQYDFQGRTDRELSFKKGDTLVVFNQVSTDWWEGAHKGKEGLIPDKYIVLKNREEDRRSASSEEDKRRSTESLPAKPFGPSSLSAEDSLDKSASHPNISLSAGNTPVTGTPLPDHPTRVSYPSTSTSTSGSSDMSSPRNMSSGSSSESSPSLTSKETLGDAISPVSGEVPTPDEEPERSTEDLQLDIDSALAEVMSGLQSLEMQQKLDKKKSGTGGGVVPPKLTLISGHPKHTPDLVLDLPVSNEPPSPKETMETDSPTHLSTAEVFANASQCTIKKGSSMPRTMTSSVTTMPSSMSSSMTESIPSSMSSSMTSFHSQGNGGPVKRSYSDNANVVRRGRPLPGRVEEREPGRPRERRNIMETPSETIREANTAKLTTVKTEVPKEKPAKPVPAERHVIHERFTPSPTPVERFTPSPTPTPAPKPPLLRPLSRGSTPDRPETKPKPPIKAKPPVMKKPARSPEVLKRLQREQEGSASPPP